MNPALKDELDEKPSAIVDVTWSTLIRSREARTKEIEGIYMFGMDFSLDLEFFKKFFKKFINDNTFYQKSYNFEIYSDFYRAISIYASSNLQLL